MIYDQTFGIQQVHKLEDCVQTLKKDLEASRKRYESFFSDLRQGFPPSTQCPLRTHCTPAEPMHGHCWSTQTCEREAISDHLETGLEYTEFQSLELFQREASAEQ